jgi:succinate-semialdehyde dehydrogenase / glutarate-semialdehyde dehydrogenase
VAFASLGDIGGKANEMVEGVRELPVSGLFINGMWQEATDDQSTITVNNPATGAEVGVVRSATRADAVAAAAAAAAARPGWRALPASSRAKILDQIVERLRYHEADLARTIVQENGKTLAEAIGEVDWARSFFSTYAAEGRQLSDRTLAKVPGKQPFVHTEPYGAVLAITPWNDPLGMIARQIAPALAAGCTVVWKPASLTPLTALKFVDLLTEVGLPRGVVNMLVTSTSNECISSVLASGLVQKLIFTGSTPTGLGIASQAAAVGIPSNLELGGNAACLVLEDADLERAADGIVLRKFVQAGQGCTCINRLFIHRNVAEQLLELLVARIAAIKLGDGLEPGVSMGPLIRDREVQRIDALVSDALAAGAKIFWRGERPQEEAVRTENFCAPQILTDVQDGMRLAQDEIFGPVLPVLLFDDVDDAIERANNVRHGLAGYVYSEPSRALAVARELEVGLVGVNESSPQAPYYPVGGIKASGWGVAGGREGLLEYLSYRSISMAVNDRPAGTSQPV